MKAETDRLKKFEKEMKAMTFKIFNGKSAKGDFQEALSDGIQKALQSTGVSDELVNWKLRKVTGENGGIAGLNNIVVTIEASFASNK
ncbi:MAG TPA: hypothetical protein VLR90_21275 [Blastocatellia bacterium]|nr:hypothetical protein [Blastocatellia bacterium]